MAATVIRIERFSPERGHASFWQDYSLDLKPGMTLLDVLNTIKWTLDGTLTYRMSCRSAICGSCAVRVNDRAVLACKTQASSTVRGGKIELRPIGNLGVIRDLVVDLEPFWSSLQKIDPWLKPAEAVPADGKERLQSHADEKRIDHSSECILCGCCYSDCNSLGVDKKYFGPATLAKAQRFVCDSRDGDTTARMNLLSGRHGIWDCTHCAECSTRCPTNAKPLERITELKSKAMRMGITNNGGARHVLGFRESVGHSGRLNENYLPVRSMGFFNIPGLLSLIPVGVRMFMRGKAPPMIHHSIDKVREVQMLYKSLAVKEE